MYELSKQEKKIASAINRTHYQLSPLINFSLSAMLSWKIGLIMIAPKDFGKSVSLDTIAKMSPYDIVRIDTATPAGLKFKKIDVLLSDNRSIMITDDLACASVGGTYIMEEFLIMQSQLIFAGRYDGGTTRQCTIKNAQVVSLAATTPATFESVMRSRSWEANTSDRFLRVYPTYHNKPDVTTENPPDIPLNNHFPENLDWKVSEKKFNEVYKMLRQQLSPHRANLAVKKLLTGHARLARRDEIIDDDVEWLKLFNPYLAIEKHFITRLHQARKGWITTSPPLFSNVLNEVLYWISLAPQSYESLVMNTQGYSKPLLQAVLARFMQRKWAEEITIEGKKRFVVSGKFKEGLDKLFTTFGCPPLSNEELMG